MTDRDWDDEYTNGAYIPGGADFPVKWERAARAFRNDMQQQGRAKLDVAYGEGPRQKLDLFMPEGKPKGLAIFVHGGYWLAFDKSSWSHLAGGALAKGYAVALPSYTLAPDASIAMITAEVAQAITHASDLVKGPITLAGHSAGGHLVSRMLCRNAPLAPAITQRIVHVISISGVHDLRPLLRTKMSSKLFRTELEAGPESPALLEPRKGTSITCWVGAMERPEFLRQNALLANIWHGFDVSTETIVEPGRHHFDVIESLADPQSELTRHFTGK